MAEDIIESPTYMGHIRHFFDEVDLVHMKKKGIDLSTYESLKARSTDVYFQTLPPDANMPPDEDRKWSHERSQTFFNWIKNGHLLGSPTLLPLSSFKSNADRTRKDVRDLTTPEIKLLKTAFQGLMDREPTDAKSYFQLCGLHWYPLPFKCKHHEARYNPWHRAYLKEFEDALRSVSGCEDVTIPYWDITIRPPKVLYESPFDSYTLPLDIHDGYPAGYVTQRYGASAITSNVKANKIAETITTALKQPIWEDFISYTREGIEAAHDAGHGACGPTLTNPDAASFDPLFWFFHSNWDRLWWEWQIRVQATTLWKFRSTIRGSTAFLEPPVNSLEPFKLTSDQTIDSVSLGIAYQPFSGLETEIEESIEFENLSFGSVRAASSIFIPRTRKASIRLKGIDRLEIPGSFRAIIEADGKEVARKTFFQSTNPKECDACRESAKINLDFIVDMKKIEGKALKSRILILTPEPGLGPSFPLHACGNPTINVRHLIEADH